MPTSKQKTRRRIATQNLANLSAQQRTNKKNALSGDRHKRRRPPPPQSNDDKVYRRRRRRGEHVDAHCKQADESEVGKRACEQRRFIKSAA